VIGLPLAYRSNWPVLDGWPPPLGATLLPQPDQALLHVQVDTPQGQSPATPARSLGVQPQQEGVQRRVVAGRSGYLVDLGQPRIR
jgi:hypothetical protein